MKVHHLNCGSMRPPRAALVCHVILLETPRGLALVDSGLGLKDAADPAGRFGPARAFVRPVFDASESAVRQVEALGYDPHDVRDIVVTHFDSDHTGGLSDFPWADVHVTAAEAGAARNPTTLLEKNRYLQSHQEHGVNWVEHAPADGEPWRGFAAAKELWPGAVLIAFPGHTRGHAAVAVDTGDGWVLHVGDSFYHPGQVDGSGKSPWSLLAMERVVAHDWKRVKANHARLAELWANPDPDVLLVNAHDPSLLETARSRSGGL